MIKSSYQIGFNSTVEPKKGNVLVTEFGSRFLVATLLDSTSNLQDEKPFENCGLRYIDVDDYTICTKPTNITKIYNTIDDLIVGNDPIWERTKWIKMSEVEARILDGLNPMNHPFIVRGTNGALYLFRSKPIRNTYTLGTGFIVENNIMMHRVDFCMFNHLFKFIKNHQCYRVEDLQKGILKEVVLESEHRKGDDKYDNY